MEAVEVLQCLAVCLSGPPQKLQDWDWSSFGFPGPKAELLLSPFPFALPWRAFNFGKQVFISALVKFQGEWDVPRWLTPTSERKHRHHQPQGCFSAVCDAGDNAAFIKWFFLWFLRQNTSLLFYMFRWLCSFLLFWRFLAFARAVSIPLHAHSLDNHRQTNDGRHHMPKIRGSPADTSNCLPTRLGISQRW